MKKISLLIILSFISCNLKKTPECNDEKVKEKVLLILKDKIKFSIIQSYSNEKFSDSSAAPAEAGPNDYLYSDEQYKIANSYAENLLKNIKLSNIITNEKADSIRKCNCESHIEIERLGKLNIRYSAQSTDDGEPFVKVEIINEE